MDEMENRLRSALQRKAPPVGFAARVLARVENGSGSRAPARWRLSRPVVWAAAGALVLAAGVGSIEHKRRVDRRNRAALAETLTAISLAAAHLERAQEKAFSGASWGRVGERLSRLARPNLDPATHSNEGGPRI